MPWNLRYMQRGLVNELMGENEKIIGTQATRTKGKPKKMWLEAIMDCPKAAKGSTAKKRIHPVAAKILG